MAASRLIDASCGFERRRLFWHAFLPASVPWLVLFRRAAIAATWGGGGGKWTFFVVVYGLPHGSRRLPFVGWITPSFSKVSDRSAMANLVRNRRDAGVAIRLGKIGLCVMVFTPFSVTISRPSWSGLQFCRPFPPRSMHARPGLSLRRPHIFGHSSGRFAVGIQRRGDDDINSGPVRELGQLRFAEKFRRRNRSDSHPRRSRPAALLRNRGTPNSGTIGFDLCSATSGRSVKGQR